MSEIYEETSEGNIRFSSQEAASKTVKIYVERKDFYSSPQDDSYLDRVYTGKFWGRQVLTRVGDVLEPEDDAIKNEIKAIIEQLER